jgi:hypothetical protein
MGQGSECTTTRRNPNPGSLEYGERQAGNFGTPGPSNSEMEPNISDLAGIQVTMTLEQLLRLVMRFREGIRHTLEGVTAKARGQ